MSQNFPSSQSSHLFGLDGLRAVAVLAVIFYHLNLSDFFPGGFLGVDIFFTLSGFLITSLLLREREREGRISLGNFYLRRLRRLAPAMIGVIGICALLVQGVAEDAASQLREDIPAALLYYSNWWQIVSQQSYFEMMSRPPLLQHLWSLAIEEQFYLLWPLVMILATACFGRRGLLAVAAALALLSSGWMALLAVQGNIPLEGDANRLYLGTDTHTTGLFAGAVLACLWDPWRMQAWLSRRLHSAHVTQALGIVGLATLLALFVWANDTQNWLYRGGFLLVAVATAAAIIGATAPSAALAYLLGRPVMRYLGERSYSLYLWHWPVFVLLRPEDFTLPSVVTELLRLLVTVLASELSFRYIEEPLRHGRLPDLRRHTQIYLVLLVCLAVSATVSLYERDRSSIALASVAATGTGDGVPSPSKAAAATPVTVACEGEDCLSGAPVQLESFSGTVAGLVDMLALGDSVMLGARNYMLRGLPGVWIDAQVGRQGRDALRIVRKLREQNKLPAVVVIHLGTNGYLPAAPFRQLINELSDRERVVLVNVHASRRWIADNNRLLGELGQSQSRNVSLVDWHTLSEDHPEYFVSDGVHLSSKGITAYVNAIRVACNITGAFLTKKQVAHLRAEPDANEVGHAQKPEVASVVEPTTDSVPIEESRPVAEPEHDVRKNSVPEEAGKKLVESLLSEDGANAHKPAAGVEAPTPLRL